MTSVVERELTTPEIKIFGEYPQMPVEVHKLVMLSQVRSGLNPELPELKESIRTKGLLNPIDVAVMAEPQLEAYIDFVNSLWGTDMSVSDFKRQEAAGLYYVVIAGHTRTEAIKQLADEDETDASYNIIVKLHDVSDPQEIIALQLDENIHAKPAQERRAMAIVEAYMYGLQTGQWHSEQEFLDVSGERFSKTILREALGFARLPRDARDFVFAGKMSYAAGVAIGLATPTILEYTTARLGYDEIEFGDEERATLNDSYRDTVSLLIAQIGNRNLNSTAAKKFIKGREAEMRRWLSAQRNENEQEQAMFNMVTAAEQAAAYRRSQELEAEAVLRDIANKPHEKTAQILKLHAKLRGKKSQEALAALEASLESGRRALGDLATRASA